MDKIGKRIGRKGCAAGPVGGTVPVTPRPPAVAAAAEDAAAAEYDAAARGR